MNRKYVLKDIDDVMSCEEALANALIINTGWLSELDIFGYSVCTPCFKQTQALLRGDWAGYKQVRITNTRKSLKRLKKYSHFKELKFYAPDLSNTTINVLKLKKRKRPAKRRGIG